MAFLLHYDYEEATTLEHSTFNTTSIKLLNHPLFVFYDLSAEIQTNVTQRQFTFHNKCSCKPFRFFFSFNLNQICKHLLAFQLFILIKYFFWLNRENYKMKWLVYCHKLHTTKVYFFSFLDEKRK